ncbi:hypothetical protein GGR55DRAFT_662132 [Xylaria sp. FL0064]|nr:hypothetical protein GGR55DRAFT_662132 [Xylaria sp. FL0064]
MPNMKPIPSSKSGSRHRYFVQIFANGELRKKELCCPWCWDQTVNDPTQRVPPARKDLSAWKTAVRNRIRLSIVSASISLSSSLFVGPLVTSYAGWSMDRSSQRLWSPAGTHRIASLQLLVSDPNTIPPIQRVTVIFHIFCLSSLVLYRSRKKDPYQATITILVAMLGVSLYLFLAFEESHMDIIGSLISILPCFISLGVILGASLHPIWHFTYAHRSGMNGKIGSESNVQMSTGML